MTVTIDYIRDLTESIGGYITSIEPFEPPTLVLNPAHDFTLPDDVEAALHITPVWSRALHEQDMAALDLDITSDMMLNYAEYEQACNRECRAERLERNRIMKRRRNEHRFEDDMEKRWLADKRDAVVSRQERKLAREIRAYLR